MAELSQLDPPREAPDVRRNLIDGCGRRIDSLRISVTDACDLRCVYCRPGMETGDVVSERALSDEQRLQFVRFLHDRHGLAQVRITGGEPLLYEPVVSLVEKLRANVPDVTLAMTTSGRRLTDLGVALRRAGLDRLNVSLDSLNPDRYHRITGGRLDDVLAGLDSASDAGFAPAKVNTVVMRGVNDDEVVDIVEWALPRGHVIRFLEAMPIGPAAGTNGKAFVPSSEVRERIGRQFELVPLREDPGSTAKDFEASNGSVSGVVGFISPVSESFCGDCRRIRLTADGRLYPCLLDDRSVDMRSSWSTGSFHADRAAASLKQAVIDKQPRGRAQGTPMVTLGG